MPFIVPNAHHAWTPDEEIVLNDLYLKGDSAASLALRFGVSENAVRRRLSRLGVKRGHGSRAAKEGHQTRARKRTEKQDIATRLRILLGEEVRQEIPREPFSDEELLSFTRNKGELDRDAIREHLLYLPRGVRIDWERLSGLNTFAREVLDVTLMAHQLAMGACVLNCPRSLLLAGRQSGKDFTQAVLGAWLSVTQPNAAIVLTSAAQRQSDELAHRTLWFFAQDPKLFDSVQRSTRERVSLRNGSTLHFLPASGVIRGLRAHYVFVNEARDLMNEDETFASVEPMLTTTGGHLAIFTTPAGKQGRLWEWWGSPMWGKTQIPSHVSDYADKDHLERSRTLDPEMYKTEYLAEFSAVMGTVFPVELLDRVTSDYPLVDHPSGEGKTYSLGIDWARTRDSSVMIIVSKDSEGLVRVEHVDAFLGVPLDRQVDYVQSLRRTWHFRAIVSEAAGLGIGPSDQLVADIGRGLVVEFRPTAENKAKGYDSLKSLMERGHLELPKHPRLQSELRGLGFKLTEMGTRTIHGVPDDHADGLMLACWPFRTTTFKPGIIPIPANLSHTPPAKRSIIEQYFPLDVPGRKPDLCSVCNQPTEFPRVIRGGKYYHPSCQDEGR